MDPPIGSPHLLVGNKGSGKSAVIDFALRVLSQQSVPAVMLTPFDIDSSNITDGSSTGDMTREFYDTLMSSIARKLSENSTGWLNGNQAILYRHAVESGARSPDFVGRMGKFLGEVAKPLLKVDLNAAFPYLTQVTRVELESALERALNTKSFYLFIDDTDQIADPEKPGHLNRIWALLLAVRRLTSQIPEVRAVISLRSEVWARLQVDPAGQRDQTDHFKNLCVTLQSDRIHVGSIVDRRLSLAANILGIRGEPYAPFFEGSMARAPYSDAFRSWKDLIVVRSRERPRDAIQLVNTLAKRATQDKKLKIDEGTFQSVMPAFSAQVALQFSQEVVLECPRALEIIRTLAGFIYSEGGFTMSSDQALNHFRSIFSRFSITLYGKPLNASNEIDIFELWKFFYVNGVLNARVSDKSQSDGYKHLDPREDSTLVSKPRWNDLQGTLWEVNTVYRDYLMTLEKEAQLRTGLAVRRAQPNRRKRKRN